MISLCSLVLVDRFCLLEFAKRSEVKFHQAFFPLSQCLSGDIQALFLEIILHAT